MLRASTFACESNLAILKSYDTDHSRIRSPKLFLHHTLPQSTTFVSAIYCRIYTRLISGPFELGRGQSSGVESRIGEGTTVEMLQKVCDHSIALVPRIVKFIPGPP